MQRFTDRTVIVTGSSKGIGSAIAHRFAQEGANVVLNSRSREDLESVASDLDEARTLLVEGDVSDVAFAKDLVKRTVERFGGLDCLVNNAGTTKHARDHSDLDALTREDFLDLYAVNVAGPFLMMQACKPLLIESHRQTGRAAAVLNTSSIAGVTGIGSSVAYAATKGALNTMTLSLARALAPEIRVNAICPGFIGTRWFKDKMDEEQYQRMEASVAAATPLNVASGPDDIADSALFFLTDASRHVTGETLLVDAGTHLGYAPLTAR